MKKNKVLYLLTIIFAVSKLYGMEPKWGTQSMIIQPHPLSLEKNIIFEEEELNKNNDLDDFKKSCSNLQFLLNNLKIATSQDEIALTESVLENALSNTIDFIQKKDPKSEHRIKHLHEIKDAIATKQPHTNKNIEKWKKIVESSCNLTINNIEAFKSGDINAIEASTILFKQPTAKEMWPTTPQEQVDYIFAKEWGIPTKTYILQLLWWNIHNSPELYTLTQQIENAETRLRKLKTAKKNAKNSNEIRELQEEEITLGLQNKTWLNKKKKLIGYMHIFGTELQNMKQPLPSIAHKKGQKPYPQFTFQLTTIPKDIAPELKTILIKSLNKQQKEMIVKRREIEKQLAQHYELLEKKGKLSKQDYLDHKNLLEQYLQILLPQDKELKQKITTAIENIDTKIARAEEKEEIIQSKITEVTQQKTKEFQEKHSQKQQRIQQEQLALEQLQKKHIETQLLQQQEKRSEAIKRAEKKQNQQKIEKLSEQRAELQRLVDEHQERTRLDAELQKQEQLAQQQQLEQKRAQQWRPWLKRNFTIFARTIQEKITSWWSWITGKY